MKNFLVFFFILLALSCNNSQKSREYVSEGNKMISNGAFDEAIVRFNKAIDLDSNNSDAYRGLSYCYLILNDYKKALINTNKYIYLNPKSPLGYADRGNIFVTIKQYQKAVDNFNRVIALDSVNKMIGYVSKAQALFLNEEYREAIECYDSIIRINPSDAKTYYRRGLSYFKTGHKDNACMDYQKALSLGYKEAETEISHNCK